jgi:hypothetical protein
VGAHGYDPGYLPDGRQAALAIERSDPSAAAALAMTATIKLNACRAACPPHREHNLDSRSTNGAGVADGRRPTTDRRDAFAVTPV